MMKNDQEIYEETITYEDDMKSYIFLVDVGPIEIKKWQSRD